MANVSKKHIQTMVAKGEVADESGAEKVRMDIGVREMGVISCVEVGRSSFKKVTEKDLIPISVGEVGIQIREKVG